ncbi:MAG: hypothetical protein CBE35_00850 [Candidatus Pelagibacter sp. TMED275]|nr:MAG: hypothetical protein CBE35_00850 [Candidatus Pelagibacter sp. TMED275]
MLKKIMIGLLLVSSLFGVDLIKKEAKQSAEKKYKFFSGPKSLFSFRFADKFFKYSTAYASFSLNAPRYKDDRFAIVGGLSTGDLVVERTEGELKPDFQTSFGIRKVGRFQYEPKRGVKSAGKGGTWYDGSEHNANESATFGPVKGWEYLIKWSEGRQWGNEYVNQEYWLRYIGDWMMVKVGMTELGLEDIAYGQADLRVHLTPEALGDKLHFSLGVKHRQHPVYGFDAMVLDTTWYRGAWWAFAETAFGIDDNEWRDPAHFDEDGNWFGTDLLEYRNGEWVTLDPDDGGGPFWNDDGQARGYDWLWRDADGKLFAYTDREYFLYHFPSMLEEYIGEKKKALGNQNETSLVIGVDYYHYGDNWWLHGWGNWLPVHYGHDLHAYHNAAHYGDHLDQKGKPHEFKFKDAMWHDWNDYDMGAIFGVKIQDNLGVFAEGRYLFYWERPAYDIKLGVNYQFMGF